MLFRSIQAVSYIIIDAGVSTHFKFGKVSFLSRVSIEAEKINMKGHRKGYERDGEKPRWDEVEWERAREREGKRERERDRERERERERGEAVQDRVIFFTRGWGRSCQAECVSLPDDNTA